MRTMLNKKRYAGNVICILFMIISTFTYKWTRINYGNISLEEILFTLNMPLAGTSSSLFFSYLKDVLCVSVILWAGILLVSCPTIRKGIGLFLFPRWEKHVCYRIHLFPLRIHKKKYSYLLAGWFAILLIMADRSFGIVQFAGNQLAKSQFIRNEYVDPNDIEITFPEQKKNLICIFVESAESSNQDRENGGLFSENYTPEMTELAQNNVSFSQSELIEGAAVAPASGWTIAGLVAETAGVPLKLLKYDDVTTDNSMGEYASFLPGVVSLGDILEKEGYHNYFMAGSLFEFGGRETYFKQHGNYEIWDLETAREKGKIPSDYYVWWGFEDSKLYEYAKEQLVEISDRDELFNFNMITVDTHQPYGYVCELCENQYEDQYANVWACASRQLNDFVEWITEQDFYENTAVVILGDHCSMVPDSFYADVNYDKHNGSTERKVYNAFLNASFEPVNEKNRQFTTLDCFPTILASIGVRIEGDRLGLGTNLFSDRETLAEEYGYDVLFTELNKKSGFYNTKLLFE